LASGGSRLRHCAVIAASGGHLVESGAKEETRTLTPFSWQRILSRSGAHPPSGSVRVVESFLADRHLRGLSPSTCRFYEGYPRRFVHAIDKSLLEVSKADLDIVLASLSCNAGGKHAYYRVLRAFFRWACQEGLLANSPMVNMKAPAAPVAADSLVAKLLGFREVPGCF